MASSVVALADRREINRFPLAPDPAPPKPSNSLTTAEHWLPPVVTVQG